MLKLEQSQENLQGHGGAEKQGKQQTDTKPGKAIPGLEDAGHHMNGPLADYLNPSQLSTQPHDGGVNQYGYASTDYFDGVSGTAGSLENTDFLGADYYYYAGGPVSGHPIDTAFYNWHMANAGGGAGGQGQGGDYPGAQDLMTGTGPSGLISEYEYGIYAAAAAAVASQHQLGAYVEALDMPVMVKMPDAMLYPALDEPSSAGLTAEAALLNAEQQAGIFNDYFNLNHGAATASHPYFYGAGEDGASGISHVKPSDVISPELFQSMHIPMVYGGYQPSIHLMDKQQQQPQQLQKKTTGTQSGGSAKKKAKKPSGTGSTVYGPSFFIPSHKDASCAASMDINGEAGAHPVQTSANGIPSVIGEDGKVYQKPPYSYAALISRALRECDGAKLTLSGIYEWIKSNFPYYRTAEAAWQV